MRVLATSDQAQFALSELSQVQSYFVNQLSTLSTGTDFTPVEWLRDQGSHGGGQRFEATTNSVFNRASVNVSQVQYEDKPEKAFLSATALSTIIHPQHPLAPSIHIHVSWTELKNGQRYWRLMADLNPAIEDPAETSLFNKMLQQASGDYYESGIEQGEQYFYIPSLNKHRGVSHFYLEGFTGDVNTPKLFAIDFARQVVDCYIAILTDKFSRLPPPSDEELNQQLDYHTLYFYQVLTLDKGTTAGLLIHSQNDVGTLGSLPAYINRDLLASWVEKSDQAQQPLVQALVDLFPAQRSVHVTPTIKAQIAETIRVHYKQLSVS
ncbi:coproporphyrinogen III oxidase [Psychromonas sp. B3M02]|uniref:coproporphyrinogen III oxidase n=1 Tax=Psychromonas sp. B3M02 TaxID=2267226 RepID=UPI000DE9F831|nr:coproporphyrinogen III oxidase [Psychromonas sp. B3M02]RBW47035.1 coproporphyrinogen III oxidase [Psychromonas sp. B3M02]